MRVIGCSGFPVPATKYLKEFNAVEIADTALGVPGPALVRRWRREAPEGFVFTALAPKDVSSASFEQHAAGDAAWATFLPVSRELASIATVITSPEVALSKKSRAAARAMLERLLADSPPKLVWEAPADWPLKDAEAVAKDLDVVVARDPYRHPPVQRASFAYYRLPGPAGFKSRYEESGIETAAQCLRETHAETVICVLANVDMYADAKRIRASIE
jgi:uncharacterized protein YecE (DUF72 family)